MRETIEDVRSRLIRCLSDAHNARKESAARQEGACDAAVLVPIVDRADGPHVVFEVRAAHLKHQPGEVCLPGGRVEEGETPLEAALRETAEELLVDSAAIDILGEVPLVPGPRRMGVRAFVGIVEGYEGSFDAAEVGSVFEMPLKWFSEHPAASYRVSALSGPPRDFPWDLIPGGRAYPLRSEGEVPFYLGTNPVIWGFTARVMRALTLLCADPNTPPHFGECHAHIAMDGIDYRQAMDRHLEGPDEGHVLACLKAYRAAGVPFVRDGGDAYGVSLRAAELAPQFEIDYRTPAFAIHKAGHYGSIVGRAFHDLREFAVLVQEADREGADFIKIMTTGIMDFNRFGRITHADLAADEVREMVSIAHDQGLAVMSHTNGKRAVLDALEAGVDSIEHGNYMDDECLDALAETGACLVPTATVARNLMGTGRFDEQTLSRIWESSKRTIARAQEKGCLLALGSDAGAVGVPHARGAHDEYACFADAIPDKAARDGSLARGEAFIRTKFARRHD